MGCIAVTRSAEQVGKEVRHKETKSGKGRTVVLSTTVLEELAAQAGTMRGAAEHRDSARRRIVRGCPGQRRAAEAGVPHP